MKAAAIIPVYNEGERVLAVIDAANNCKNIGETIVVDDGSTDDTTDILSDMKDITVFLHEHNRGKGEALDTGVNYARELGYTAMVFLDGDLKRLEPHHIDDLLQPLDGGSYMSIGYLGLRKAALKKVLAQWGALSGQRAIQAEMWDFLSDHDKHGFNTEAALNARLRHRGLHHTITRVELDGVSHVGKHDKEKSWPKAVWAYTKTYGSAAATYARIELEGLI